ncbi:MAG: hypothetical protein HYY06_14400 [Deltaproteobacteria bacterium]|nr:hypothetical protein [Deltaproteobacteria bacterium]
MRSLAVLSVLLLPAIAGARQVDPERWSAGPSVGVELESDSIGAGLESTPLYGVAGTLRLHRLACVDAHVGIGGSVEDGSETTRAGETRLRFDLRGALCVAVSGAATFVVGLGPALGLSMLDVRVGDREVSTTGVDIGGSLDGGVLFRFNPIVVRLDLEMAILSRLTLGMFFSAGVAL